MEWLTLTEIGRRARSKKGALEVSYEHWNQLYQATAKELRVGYKNDKVTLGIEHCGLCRYYNFVGNSESCSRCPLGQADGSCPNKFNNLFAEARRTFLAGDWWAWKRAAKALRDKLKELMEK